MVSLPHKTDVNLTIDDVCGCVGPLEQLGVLLVLWLGLVGLSVFMFTKLVSVAVVGEAEVGVDRLHRQVHVLFMLEEVVKATVFIKFVIVTVLLRSLRRPAIILLDLLVCFTRILSRILLLRLLPPFMTQGVGPSFGVF